VRNAALFVKHVLFGITCVAVDLNNVRSHAAGFVAIAR